MNNGIQKLISMVLALSLCISVTTETAAATASSSLHAAASDGPAEQVSCETVTDTTQITEVVQDYWDNAYFEEVVIDPEQETVTKDGTKTTLQKALDLSRSDAEAAMESTDAAEEYFSDSISHSETTKGRRGDRHSPLPDQTDCPLCRCPLRFLWRSGGPVLSGVP